MGKISEQIGAVNRVEVGPAVCTTRFDVQQFPVGTAGRGGTVGRAGGADTITAGDGTVSNAFGVFIRIRNIR